MIIRLSAYLVASIGILAGSLHGAGAARAGEGVGAHAKDTLESAFEKRFDVDTIANIELVMKDRSGQELRRLLHGVSKVIDGRVHSVGRITWPERLRDMTVLSIEATDRSHDAFVYLPSLKRVRRISTAQRGESFFGTDVTYEDLERRRARDFEIVEFSEGRHEGEEVFLIYTVSLRELTYERARFVVARSDLAILETHYYKRDQESPFRTIVAPREHMIERDGHVLPTRLVVLNHAASRTTEVTFRDLKVNPEIDDRVFTVGSLAHESPIPRPKDVERAERRSESDG